MKPRRRLRQLNFKSKKVNYGGSFHSLGKVVQARQVKLSDILKVVKKNVQVVAKVDIEGGEYHLLRSLLISGVACRLDVLVIEWHSHKITDKDWPKNVEDSIKWLLEGKQCDVIVLIDD